MSWIDLGPIEAIPLRGTRRIKTARGCVALFRTDESEVFAAADRCPHRGGPLSEGIVHGQSVTCPLHGLVFDLATGAAVEDGRKIATYPCRVEGGRIMIDASALPGRSAA